MADPVLARDLLPEDAYDGSDPFPLRLAVLERMVESVRDDPDEASRTLRRRLALQMLDRLGDELLGLMDRVTAVRAALEQMLEDAG